MKKRIKFIINVEVDTDFKDEYITGAINGLIEGLKITLYGKANSIELKKEYKNL